MPSAFSRIYPPEGRIFFDGGLDSNYDRAIIADNESADCLNVVANVGAIETRLGSKKLNTFSVGTFVANGIYTRHDNTGAQSMCAFFGQHMYTWNGNSFVTVPSAQSVWTAGSRITGAEYENYLFLGDGNTDPYKYNSHFTRHGVPAPTATASVASFATGLLTGGYNYVITYVNSAAVEGNISPVTSTFTAASATLRITSIPLAPVSFGVNSRRIYRTTTGSITPYKRVATLSDNTTTTYDDNTADVGLGTNAPTDNGTPPKYKSSIVHQNRIFCDDPANPNFVWYSNLANPYVFASTNFIRIGDNTSDIVRGFAVYDNSLVILCDINQWIIYMPSTDPTQWVVIKLRASYGCKSHFGTFQYNNKVMFAAIQSDRFAGFAAISGATLDPSATILTVSSAGSDLKSDPIEKDMFNIQEAHLRNISAIAFQNKGYISVPYGTGQATNNRIYFYDFSISRLNRPQEGAWFPWTGIHAEQFCVLNNKLYFISSDADGFVKQMNVDNLYADDTTAIDSYYWTKEFVGNLGDTNISKDFRYAGILFENSGDYFMGLNYRVNSDNSNGNVTQIDLTPGGGIWGTLIWGSGVWGGGSIQNEIRQYLGQLRGKRIQFKFSNQNKVNQKFKVVGMNFVYNNKGLR